MQKIIKVGDRVTVLLDNGSFIEGVLNSDSFKKLVDAKTDNEVISILNPEHAEIVQQHDEAISLIDRVQKSNVLSVENNTIYWKKVSSLSIPEELAERIIQAEQANDDLKLHTYRNFWTLMSLNPNEECRKNLFWFLQKYDMTIAKCGFFVAYRNVDTTDESDVFTDHYTHSFKVKIGEMITMNRDECDCNSSISCSRGLHCAGKGWLKANYYGNVGLACLVNPADVVAVPHIDNYGKLRTCAYLPMEIIHYDENDDVVPLNVEDGFDCNYVTKVIYEGTMGTEEDSPYKINIPNIPGTTVESIQDTLLDIAKDCIVNRNL